MGLTPAASATSLKVTRPVDRLFFVMVWLIGYLLVSKQFYYLRIALPQPFRRSDFRYFIEILICGDNVGQRYPSIDLTDYLRVESCMVRDVIEFDV
jgi:hypothetical protein